MVEHRIEYAEELRSPFPKVWGLPPCDPAERLAWAKRHAAQVPQQTMERRRHDPAAIAIANTNRQRMLQLLKLRAA